MTKLKPMEVRTTKEQKQNDTQVNLGQKSQDIKEKNTNTKKTKTNQTKITLTLIIINYINKKK